MIIFTAVWGDHYMRCMKEGLRRSLAFPSNAEAVKDATWIIPTLKENETFCREVAGDIRTEFVFADIEHNENGIDFIQRGLCYAIKACLERNESFLMALPDSVFAEGTIKNMVDVGNAPALCVCFAHMRVLPSFLDEMDGWLLTPEKMVSMAYRHAHPTWSNAKAGLEMSNSFHGGIVWKRLTDKLVAVQHRLPTASYVNFVPEDLEYFKKDRYDGWDHRWPETWNQRMRYLGSSDAAFMVEVTQPKSNLARINRTNFFHHTDSYREDRTHHRINRQILAIFREE